MSVHSLTNETSEATMDKFLFEIHYRSLNINKMYIQSTSQDSAVYETLLQS